MTVSFLPVFTLEQVEGRMFRPLALTKTFAMGTASIPALMVIFVKGKIRPESNNPIARFFIRIYRPVIRGTLKHPWAVVLVSGVLLLLTLLPVQRMMLGRAVVPFPQIGSEFMPSLNEGDVLIAAFDAAIQIPGLTNAWTMPIKTRTDMLATGIKIAGEDLWTLQRIGEQIEGVLKGTEGTLSVYDRRGPGALRRQRPLPPRPALGRTVPAPGARADPRLRVCRLGCAGAPRPARHAAPGRRAADDQK